VLTPCHGPDVELCRDLHRSVLELTPASTVHYLVVPSAQRSRFATFEGARCEVWAERALLPRRVVGMSWVNPALQRLGALAPSARLAAVNVRRPWPPVRGWIMQQILKLAATALLDADVVLLMDADVQLIRPVTASSFLEHGQLRLYRVDGGVHPGMSTHVAWHRTARRLLGLAEGAPPYPDYASSFMAWDPAVVRAVQHRVEQITGRPWVDAVGGTLSFSEWTLYGTFVDDVLAPGARPPATDRSGCHSYWDTSPLTGAAAARFVESTAESDLAAMISAKSGTPLDERRRIMAEITTRAASAAPGRGRPRPRRIPDEAQPLTW
jgi:hypothetical protein